MAEGIEEYKKRVQERLKTLSQILEKVVMGVLPVNMEIPENDEFTEVFAGLSTIVDDFYRVSKIEAELRSTLDDRVKERTKKLEDSRSAMIYMMKDLKRTGFELEKKIRDLERFQKVTMDREKRVLELKKEIKELKKQLEREKEWKKEK